MDDEPLIRARGLVKRFGDFTAVDAIDVAVAPGEAFGFLGPNGAGKSSTMRMIGAVSPPTAGELLVLGMDPAVHGPEIRARLGVVPQTDNLDVELTVEENLHVYGRYFGLPKATVRARAAELLDFVQLGDRAASKVEPLSGGMKRRLTIARALINEPDLMLLDEPTTGLDPQAATCCGSGSTGSSSAGSPSSSRRTTWTRPSSCATGWSSWTRAGSWPRARRPS